MKILSLHYVDYTHEEWEKMESVGDAVTCNDLNKYLSKHGFTLLFDKDNIKSFEPLFQGNAILHVQDERRSEKAETAIDELLNGADYELNTKEEVDERRAILLELMQNPIFHNKHRKLVEKLVKAGEKEGLISLRYSQRVMDEILENIKFVCSYECGVSADRILVQDYSGNTILDDQEGWATLVENLVQTRKDGQ